MTENPCSEHDEPKTYCSVCVDEIADSFEEANLEEKEAQYNEGYNAAIDDVMNELEEWGVYQDLEVVEALKKVSE